MFWIKDKSLLHYLAKVNLMQLSDTTNDKT